MGYRHRVGTTGYWISETIHRFSPKQIEQYCGKGVDALRKDANPNTGQRLGYDDAILLDNLWFDTFGTRPFLERAKMMAHAHNDAVASELDRTGNVLNLSELAGKACAAVRDHDADGIHTLEEIEEEIKVQDDIIRNASEAKKGLVALRAKAGAG